MHIVGSTDDMSINSSGGKSSVLACFSLAVLSESQLFFYPAQFQFGVIKIFGGVISDEKY